MPPIIYRRIGFLGDVHAEDERLEVALAEFCRANVEVILCVGDIVDGLGDLASTISLLCDHGVRSVRGNHERWFLSDMMRELPNSHLLHDTSTKAREYLISLPQMLFIETIRGPLVLCHGLGDDDMGSVEPWEEPWRLRQNMPLQRLLWKYPARFYLNGHSHRRMVRAIEKSLFINAGTLFREHDPCFGLLDLEGERLEFRLFGQNSLEIERVEVIPFPLENGQTNPDEEPVTPRDKPF